MADERDDQFSGSDESRQKTAGQQGQSSEYGSQGQESMSDEGSEGSGQSSSGQTSGDRQSQGGGMSGQPIGGNDSNTGSGTTLTSGYTPPAAGYEERLASDGTGAVAANQGSDSSTHTSQGGSGMGSGTTSNMGGSTAGSSQTSGRSSGVSGGEGFIGSQAESTDFARAGRGATDEEDSERTGQEHSAFTSGDSSRRSDS